MAIDIKLVLDEHEQLIYHSMNLVSLTGQISSKIQNVAAALPELSSEGAFHDLIATSGSNAGLGLYILKAQEFGTVSEVLYQHAQNTYEKMVDMDKVLAAAIANFVSEDPNASAADKEAIRNDPKGSVEQIKQNYQEQVKQSQKGAGQ